MLRLLFAAWLIWFAQALPANATPSWGAKQSSSADTTPSQLQPGEWFWGGDDKAMGPMALIVSLTEQRAYVYRNGILIAFSSVSTGKPGHETPTGVFTILQKDKHHHSNKYNNAAMPYQERLTWDGIALHAGGLPGYPESHGCVHLPTEFARLLFDSTTLGMTVVVSKENKASERLVHPGAASPIHPMTGAESASHRLAGGEQFRWQPMDSPVGPISILISTADLRLLVYRNGLEIGRSRIAFRKPGPAQGTHAYVLAANGASGAQPSWIHIGLPGHLGEANVPVDEAEMARLVVPPEFLEVLRPLLVPGTVVVETNEHVLPASTGSKLQVLNSDAPAF
ncbi:L,D-transpeptidase [Variovorax sp. HJSM1_2]|uniref:L,D-transpeptidase n=1 Tax=Variovorax sp. HJSM1_2 TaxID=3366263 RepID=UPI003BC7EF72